MPESLEDVLVNPPDAAPLPEPNTPPAPDQAAFSLPPAISTRMQSLGLKADGIDSHDKAYEFLLSQYEQSKPYAEFGRSTLASRPHPTAERETEQVDETPAQDEFDLDGHFSSLWKAPQIDDSAKFLISNGIVELGEDGLYAAKPGYEAMALPVLNSLNQAHIAQREQMKSLFEGNFYQNIDKGLWPAVEYRVKQMLQEQLGQQFQHRDQVQSEQSLIEKFREANAAFLYTPDGTAFTEAGQKFSNIVDQYMQKGLPLADAIEVARAFVPLNNVGGQQDAGGKEAAATNTKGPTKDPVTGKFVKSEPTKQESFLDDAKRKAGQGSNQGGYADAENVIANDGELDNLWDAGWQRHKAAGVAA